MPMLGTPRARVSEEGKARMAAAARVRWAKMRGEAPGPDDIRLLASRVPGGGADGHGAAGREDSVPPDRAPIDGAPIDRRPCCRVTFTDRNGLVLEQVDVRRASLTDVIADRGPLVRELRAEHARFEPYVFFDWMAA